MIGTNIHLMIGLESHIQLATKSKLFCSCSTNSSAEPNENTCEICLGYPGTKPTLNKEVVRKALMLAKIMNCKINYNSKFNRKIYFYPDLPKSFQITQYEEPIAVKGEFSIDVSASRLPNGANLSGAALDHSATAATEKKTIHITRAHIEEDPGKIEYVGGHIGTAKYVLVDYNRCGVPLCEVVTDPDFRSIDEAVTYVKKLFHLLSYLDIIDPNQEGVMRTDANISINGGKRVELKNISGSDALEKALKSELSRQSFLFAQGKVIEQETRMYSEETGTTILLRKKEQEEDYGYIREPDLLPITIDDAFVQDAWKQMKKLPEEVESEIISKYKLSKQIAYQLAFKRGLYAYYQSCLKYLKNSDLLAKWLVGDFLKCANWHNYEIEKCPSSEKLIEFMQMIETGKISEREGKELIKKMFDDPKKGLGDLAEKKGVDLDSVISEVLKENQKSVDQIKAGDPKAINFLIGQVLRKAGFKGDPNEIRKKLEKLLT
ncbi:MAG: Asp-tRNA(Asn)/Glu-tRNA(Gln) amidotransferase subunit GatB [Candidatus Micrarchaeota archaeon]|nr:Asp-tRNA(Asn)/Glu-tRNA(Gln) amidotransferase subunit GatB [Candidatus Micrarchaeota archaeon]